MNPLLKAIAAGYTADQIFGYMSQSMPSVFSYVQRAKKLGYGANEILSYMANSSSANGDEYVTPAQLTARQAEIDGEKTRRLLGFTAALGAGALGALGMSMMPSSQGQESNGEPSADTEEQQRIQSIQPTLPTSPSGAVNPDGQSSTPENIPQEERLSPAASGSPASGKAQPLASAKNLMDEMELSGEISRYAKKNISPNDIAAVLDRHILKPHQKKWLKSQTKEPLESIVNRFLEETKGQASSVPAEAMQSQNNSPLESPKIDQQLNQPTLQPPTNIPEIDDKLIQENIQQEPAPRQELPVAEEPETEEDSDKSSQLTDEQKLREFRPGKRVMLPDGTTGFITHVKDGIATVKSTELTSESKDGKVTVSSADKSSTRKVVDLEDAPLTDEEIGDFFDRYNANLREGYRSANIEIAGYDEQNNRLMYTPHQGASYVYENIPKEFADKLKSMMHKAKTTGSNMFGVWERGKRSRGAGIYEIIKQLQAQQGKGNEYSGKYDILFRQSGYGAEQSKKNQKDRGKK